MNEALARHRLSARYEVKNLDEAIAQIQRYRQAPIRLEDPALAQLPISGVFNTDNVEDLLDLFPHILPLTMARDADGTLHITHKPAKK